MANHQENVDAGREPDRAIVVFLVRVRDRSTADVSIVVQVIEDAASPLRTQRGRKLGLFTRFDVPPRRTLQFRSGRRATHDDTRPLSAVKTSDSMGSMQHSPRWPAGTR